jgi:TrmH family RNA methyltransferase
MIFLKIVLCFIKIDFVFVTILLVISIQSYPMRTSVRSLTAFQRFPNNKIPEVILRSFSSERNKNRRFNRVHATSIPHDSSLLISSTANERIKLLKGLIEQKKYRDEHGLIVLEGFKQIKDAIKLHSHQPASVYVTEKAAKQFDLFLGEYVTVDSRQVFHISDAVFSHVSQTATGQGILATFPKPDTAGPVRLLDTHPNQDEEKDSAPPMILLLDRISDPGNYGTIIRSAYGLGVNAIVSIEGTEVYSPKVLRSSMGMSLNLPIYERRWSEIARTLAAIPLKHTQDTYWQMLVADGGDQMVLDYDRVDYNMPTVVVIGSEGQGVDNEAIAALSSQLVASKDSIKIQRIRIPMFRGMESLNAAMAASIILSEAAKTRR